MAKPDKTELRKEFLKKRNGLTPAVRSRDSAIIRQRIFRHPAWTDAGTAAAYVSFGSEVDTHKLIEEALQAKKRIVVPWVNPDTQEMAFSELKKWSDLVPGFYKTIFEPGPAFRTFVDPSEIEIALIPGIAFDRQGNRLGMGGGYYDRLLPKMVNAVRVGLAYEVQLSAPPLPAETHDAKLHAIVTDSEWIAIP